MRSRAVIVGAEPAPILHVDLRDSHVGDASLDALITVARRDNPKRASLIVSRVLGKHLNVAPATAIAAGTAVGELVATALDGTHRPKASDELVEALVSGHAPAAITTAADCGPAAIVLAYAETATAIGHLVRRALGPGPMLHTTRTLPPSGSLLSFTEPHSHAVEHLLFHDDSDVLQSTAPMVLVDDELTTGRTAMNTIEAIQRVAPRDRYVLAALLDLRSEEDRAHLDDVARQHGVKVDVVALVSGTTSIVETATDWTNRVATPVVASPPTLSPASVRLHIGARATARRGWTEREQINVEDATQRAASQLEAYRSGPRALVLGTEELMFVPMLLGAHLGGDVQVRSTTRSPIVVSNARDYPIVDGVMYPAVDGEGGPRYLYNLGLDRVDDVFLCCEVADAYQRSPLMWALRWHHERVHLVELVP